MMSIIRFLHTDSLRLGSPVAGLSESPDWLRKLATSAVRTAVCNVVEAAIAGRVQFILIAGRLTESAADLEMAVTWLSHQSTRLREHGIRAVIAGHSEADREALRRLDAIVLPPECVLEVRGSDSGPPEYRTLTQGAEARPGTLTVEVNPHRMRHHASGLAYTAVPSATPSRLAQSSDGTVVSHDRNLKLSAGSPQAITPDESGSFGCQLVEANFNHQTLTARFCATDVIRFSQELLVCRTGTELSQVTSLLLNRSRSVGVSDRRTTVVDWVIDGQISVSDAERFPLGEMDFLRELRNRLQAGHAGAWPRRVRFSENCTAELVSWKSPVVREFETVVRDRFDAQRKRHGGHGTAGPGLPLGGDSEGSIGLSVLRRAA